jgi:phage host-nuclease inhibitor protein Gam
MSGRVKKAVDEIQPIENRDEAETVMREMATMIFERDNQVSQMDTRMLEVRKEFEPALIPLERGIETDLRRLEKWATDNASEFGGKKSIEMLHGKLGFRTSPPALKALSKWTVDRVLAALKAAGMGNFVRTKEEIDKDGILAEHAARLDDGGSKLPNEVLKTVGLVVKQEETFFVEPKQEQQ